VVEGVMVLPDSTSAPPFGLYLQGSGDAGTAFLVRTNGMVEYGLMSSEMAQFEKKGSVDRELTFRGSTRFRLIRKGRITEFYLDDCVFRGCRANNSRHAGPAISRDAGLRVGTVITMSEGRV